MQEQTVNHKQTVRNLEIIFDNSKKSKLDYSDKTVYNAIQSTSKLLGISHIQSCLFAIIFMFNIDDNEISSERLINFLDLKITDYFDIKGDIEMLVSKNLIKYKRENGGKNLYNSSFNVNQKVIDAIFNNGSIDDALAQPELDFIQFCSHVKRRVQNNSYKNKSVFELCEQITELENKNINLSSIQYLIENKIEIEERIVLYSLIDSLTDNEHQINLMSLLKEIFGAVDSISIAGSIIAGNQDIEQKKLVEIESKGFVEDATISLTNKAKDLLLGNSANLYKVKVDTKHQLIRCESIQEKQLFFNEKLKNELDFFKASIQNDNLVKLKTKLSESKIKKSIVTIFEGIPGSGKTESCYQIAKELRYDLFVLDFTQMKSTYYSESQTLVKKSFTEFREICRVNERPVIMVINECDGLLHQRISTGDGQSSDHTENEIQTILLEEFEKSDDIIILTTNLINSIDVAFYRRFLFKIRFDNPDKEVLKQIYKSKLSWLEEEELERLSAVELSGGEVDNVVTKVLINEVINSKKSTIYDILEFCKQEKVDKKKTTKLGFN